MIALRQGIGCVLIVLGLVFLCISVVGVLRFRYVLNRLHAITVADTLGTLCMAAGVIVLRGLCLTSLKVALCLVVLWLTAPVSTHCITMMEILTNKELYKEMEVE